MEKSTERIEIVGMTCNSCVRHVRTALDELPGVEVCHIEIGAAEVSYDPDVTDRAAIVEAIKDSGYTVPQSSAAIL